MSDKTTNISELGEFGLIDHLTKKFELKNEFFNKVNELEQKGASSEELAALLGRGRAKKGMFEGDLVEGELEIGQVSGAIDNIESVQEIVNEMMEEFNNTIKNISSLLF